MSDFDLWGCAFSAPVETIENEGEKNDFFGPEMVPPPPKNFERARGDIDRVVAHSENQKPLRKKLPEKVKYVIPQPTPEELKEEATARLVEGETKFSTSTEWATRTEWKQRRHLPGKGSVADNQKALNVINGEHTDKLPSVYKHEKCARVDWGIVTDDILNFVSAGGTIAAYSRASGINQLTIHHRVRADPDFKERLALAREQGADALAAEALDIASKPMMTEETIEVYDRNGDLQTRSVRRGDNVHARKLAFNARIMLLEKWAPNKYGPKPMEEATGGMAEKLRQARQRIRQANREQTRERNAALNDALQGSTDEKPMM